MFLDRLRASLIREALSLFQLLLLDTLRWL